MAGWDSGGRRATREKSRQAEITKNGDWLEFSVLKNSRRSRFRRFLSLRRVAAQKPRARRAPRTPKAARPPAALEDQGRKCRQRNLQTDSGPGAPGTSHSVPSAINALSQPSASRSGYTRTATPARTAEEETPAGQRVGPHGGGPKPKFARVVSWLLDRRGSGPGRAGCAAGARPRRGQLPNAALPPAFLESPGAQKPASARSPGV